jgi:hypothetical protein
MMKCPVCGYNMTVYDVITKDDCVVRYRKCLLDGKNHRVKTIEIPYARFLELSGQPEREKKEPKPLPDDYWLPAHMKARKEK